MIRRGFITPKEFELKDVSRFVKQSIYQLNPGTPYPGEDSSDNDTPGQDDKFDIKKLNFEAVDWSALLVFDEKSKFSTYWNGIDIFTCIFSSYFYAYLGCFGKDAINAQVEVLIYVFEAIFVFSLLKRFITDFTPDGEQTPVTNIKKIAQFIFAN